MKAFDVYLDGQRIDTVFYFDDYVVWHVRNSLIKHDNYVENIVVIDVQTGDIAMPKYFFKEYYLKEYSMKSTAL